MYYEPEQVKEELQPSIIRSVNNEMGVVVAFTEWAIKNEWGIISIKSGFPDAIVEDDKGSIKRVEFEFLSSNFKLHGHNPQECDLVVCWEHDTSLSIPVLEIGYGQRVKGHTWHRLAGYQPCACGATFTRSQDKAIHARRCEVWKSAKAVESQK